MKRLQPENVTIAVNVGVEPNLVRKKSDFINKKITTTLYSIGQVVQLYSGTKPDPNRIQKKLLIGKTNLALAR